MARPTNVKPDEKVWLVKSAGIVLGPYSWFDLVKVITSRQISLIDEIRDPWSRWGFIRENSQMQEIVKKVRDLDSEAKDEKTSTSEPTAVDITITEDITPIPVIPKDLLAQRKSEPAKAEIKKHYGHEQDNKVQQHITKSRDQWRPLFWGAALVMVGLTIILYFVNRMDAPKSLSADDYIRLARHHRNLGVYTKALSFYRKAENIQPLDFSTRVQMIPLLLVVDNQVVEARRWLDEITKQGPVDPKIRPELDNLRGLSYLKQGNYKMAEEEFKKALGSDGQYFPAITNLVASQIMQKKYSEVVQAITDLEKTGLHSQVLELMRANSLLFQTSGKDEAKLKEQRKYSISSIEAVINNSPDFKAESYLILAALYTTLGDNDKTIQMIQKLLDEVPDRMKDIILELHTDYSFLGWEHLKPVCELLTKDRMGIYEFTALDSYCLFERNDFVTANEKLSKLREQQPTEKRWMNLQAYYLMSAGRGSEAAALVKNFTSEEYKLMNLVKGILCLEEKDLRCAETSFQSTLNKDKNEVIAYWGQAQVLLERNQKEAAKQMVRSGLVVSPNYRPLVELKEELLNEL